MTTSQQPTDSTPTTEPEIILGIDLGTTNSLAAVATPKGARVLRDLDGQALIPSVVSYRADGRIVVGRSARDAALQYPDRTVHSIKRLIGRGGDEVLADAARLPYPVALGERELARVSIDGRLHSPEAISAQILAEVKRVASAALGREVRAAVVTVPAYFDDAQRQATKHAAELAGLDCRRIINEPTAASLAYGIDGSRDGTVMVYDFGGGTFDVSILRIQDGVFRVLATAGDTHLGGDDLDRVLIERIHGIIAARDVAIDTLGPYAQQAIRRAAEQLKVQLSEAEQASLDIAVSAGDAANPTSPDATIPLTVDRADFEADIAPLVTRTIECCRRALDDAELGLDEIDDIVLVGGSTRVPLVRSMLTEFMGRPPHTGVDPDLAVALGAALQAQVLSGANRSLLLLDVIPLSLGIETMGGVVCKLIMRNATIPTSVTEEFSTQVDGQTAVDINIFQGERERVDDCRHLGSFKLRGIPPMPAGLPRVAVTFTIDADGVLRVSAIESRTGTAASIQVVPSFGLTPDEVRRMMDASIEHAFEDMAMREGIELRNKARAMVTGTQKALQMSDLPADQTWSVKKASRRLGTLVDDAQATTSDIRAAVEELSQLTGQIADDVISSAVRKALTEGS